MMNYRRKKWKLRENKRTIVVIQVTIIGWAQDRRETDILKYILKIESAGSMWGISKRLMCRITHSMRN